MVGPNAANQLKYDANLRIWILWNASVASINLSSWVCPQWYLFFYFYFLWGGGGKGRATLIGLLNSPKIEAPINRVASQSSECLWECKFVLSQFAHRLIILNCVL